VPTSEVALRIFFALLPGFTAAYLVQALTVRASKTDLEKVIEGFLFSFAIYVTFYLFHPTLSPAAMWGELSGNYPFHRLDLLSLLSITIVYALLMILFVNKDGTILLRKMGLTERTSRSSLWNEVFQNGKGSQIVQVELADGRSVQGFVDFYSDTVEESSVFLSNARWVGEDGGVANISGPGILLTKEAKIISISFLDPPQDSSLESD
jgi:hypothetical protein